MLWKSDHPVNIHRRFNKKKPIWKYKLDIRHSPRVWTGPPTSTTVALRLPKYSCNETQSCTDQVQQLFLICPPGQYTFKYSHIFRYVFIYYLAKRLSLEIHLKIDMLKFVKT